MKRFSVALVALFVGFASLLPHESAASVIYRLSGSIFEAGAGSTVAVGETITGYVELTTEAFAKSPPYEFALGKGDVLDIFVQFGSYRWDISRASVDWVQFEGYLTEGKHSIGNYSLRLIENFSGIISSEYCLPTQVCEVGGGGNGVMALYDGRGWAYGQTTWSRQVPEPSTLALLGLGLAGLAFTRRRGAATNN